MALLWVVQSAVRPPCQAADRFEMILSIDFNLIAAVIEVKI